MINYNLSIIFNHKLRKRFTDIFSGTKSSPNAIFGPSAHTSITTVSFLNEE